MKRSSRTSAIIFKPAIQVPSTEIPGGTVIEEVCVPWIRDPIGTIVSRLSDKPPDPLSRGRVRTHWFFIPVSPGVSMLKCDTILDALHLRIHERYHGIYDLKNIPRGTHIASGDDSEIDELVLKWSGMDDVWSESGLSANHSFLREVLEACPSATIRERTFEDGGPGLSGIWSSVRSRNPELLREEIAHWVQVLIDEDKHTKENPPPASKRNSRKPKKSAAG